jgi:hypothetical protein
VSVQELRRFVLEETAYPYGTKVLRSMESLGQLESAPPQLKKFDYPGDCLVRFAI